VKTGTAVVIGIIVVLAFYGFFVYGNRGGVVSGDLDSIDLVGDSEGVVGSEGGSGDIVAGSGSGDSGTEEEGDLAWIDIELEDIVTGEKFSVGQFIGEKPILLESFAVWCPTCTAQQKQIRVLHADIGDDVISISLDTDPNEDAARVREHLNRNGFDWRYAVAPADLSRGLIDDFGITVVNAPSAPVILICLDGQARLLDSGSKSADVLKAEIDRGC